MEFVTHIYYDKLQNEIKKMNQFCRNLGSECSINKICLPNIYVPNICVLSKI